MTTEQIAIICHEALKAYCDAIGDTTHAHWEDATESHRLKDKEDVSFRLKNPNASDSSQHDIWMAAKLKAGWTYGPERNEARKEHPHILPFGHLPKEIQQKDILFRRIVSAFEDGPPYSSTNY